MAALTLIGEGIFPALVINLVEYRAEHRAVHIDYPADLHKLY